MRHSHIFQIIWAAAFLAYSPADAQNFPAAPNKTFEELLQTGSVKAITPIFSQLVLVPFPQGFQPAFEDAKAAQYIQESVPVGQTVNGWTQMFTLMGFKDLAARQDLTPRTVTGLFADGFKKSCPNSFGSRDMFEGKIGGYDAFAVVLSCGVSPSDGGKSSEAAFIATIKGQADFYSVQWAERSVRSDAPIPINASDYAQRVKALQAIKLCPRLLGERAPYPSCLGS